MTELPIPDSDKFEYAIRFLREFYVDPDKGQSDAIKIAEAIIADPDKWIANYHFGWGMDLRNFLRENGFSEAKLNVGNLDDYYQFMVELVVLTLELEQKPFEHLMFHLGLVKLRLKAVHAKAVTFYAEEVSKSFDNPTCVG